MLSSATRADGCCCCCSCCDFFWHFGSFCTSTCARSSTESITAIAHASHYKTLSTPRCQHVPTLLQLSMPRRSRKCLTAVTNSHLAHMRISFSCTASSTIVSVTNAGSPRLCRPRQISVARSRIKPMCVEAARISLTRRAHCVALSMVSSNGNPAIVGSGFP